MPRRPLGLHCGVVRILNFLPSSSLCSNITGNKESIIHCSNQTKIIFRNENCKPSSFESVHERYENCNIYVSHVPYHQLEWHSILNTKCRGVTDPEDQILESYIPMKAIKTKIKVRGIMYTYLM